MNQSSAKWTGNAPSAASHPNNTSNEDLAIPSRPISLWSSVSAATLIDRGLTGSRIISSVLGRRTYHATAQTSRNHVDNRHNIIGMITVVGKDAEKTAYFDFGTRGGSPSGELRSTSETRDVIVPHLTET
jgi:hypothetical protein